MDLTDNEKKIIDYLIEQERFVSPTEIGNIVGGIKPNGDPRHSSWASPICLKLVKKGLLVRNDKGWYAVNE